MPWKKDYCFKEKYPKGTNIDKTNFKNLFEDNFESSVFEIKERTKYNDGTES